MQIYIDVYSQSHTHTHIYETFNHEKNGRAFTGSIRANTKWNNKLQKNYYYLIDLHFHFCFRFVKRTEKKNIPFFSIFIYLIFYFVSEIQMQVFKCNSILLSSPTFVHISSYIFLSHASFCGWEMLFVSIWISVSQP